MLANDSATADKSSAFFLIVHTHEAVAELMAQCPKCAAVTGYSLELAWRLGTLSCRECQQTMPLHAEHLTALRRRLIEARVRVNRLLAIAPTPE